MNIEEAASIPKAYWPIQPIGYLGDKLSKTMKDALEIPVGSNIDYIKKQIQANFNKNQ